MERSRPRLWGWNSRRRKSVRTNVKIVVPATELLMGTNELQMITKNKGRLAPALCVK